MCKRINGCCWKSDSFNRLILDHLNDELVVEIRSPRDSAADIAEKALMWLANGVLIVWTVDPDARTVDVYRAGFPVVTLADGDSLDGGDVLPGFSCAVSDIFDL